MGSKEGEYESSCSCAICMEELGSPIEACPCGHVYHKSCIREWIQQKRICPQCKGDAVPLIPLFFNIYRVDPESRGLNSSERRSSLKLELSTVSLSIETELAEINVLEPQLAECHAEDVAYRKGIEARKIRKDKLESELQAARFNLADAEKRRKELHAESESMRGKMSRTMPIEFENSSSSSSRRPIQSNEIPKVMSFLVSDARKLKEMEAESVKLKAQLAGYKQTVSELGKKMRQLMGENELVKTSMKQLASSNARLDGFVPIDAVGRKRKLEQERMQELENRKPQLSFHKNNESCAEPLEALSLLVSLLSESEEDTPRASSNLLAFMSLNSQGVT